MLHIRIRFTLGFVRLNDSRDLRDVRITQTSESRTVCELDDLTDDFDGERCTALDLLCDLEGPPLVAVLLLVFFDRAPLADAGRLLDLLAERTPLA